MWSLSVHFLIATALRLLLVCYGRIHDAVFDVRFTDVDYLVFMDAAGHVVKGESPYDRATYRYTPLLAWMLTPGVMSKLPEFGKVLFCVLDLLSAWLVLDIVRRQSGSERLATVSACLTLYNPLSAVVAARGNAESLLSTTVLLVLWLLGRGSGNLNWLMQTAVVHGLAIHLKIYPLIYLPSVFFHFCSPSVTRLRQSLIAVAGNWYGFLYGITCAVTVVVLTAVFYQIYADRFVEEALLYHLSRQDVKHNFSPYFYLLYLYEGSEFGRLVASAAFVPQLLLVLVFSWRYHDDLPFAWFVSTFAFVTFNKVCTSQYFVWYLCLLPLIWYKLRVDMNEVFSLATLWTLSQALWLAAAYLLEFRGWNVFIFVWIASIVFFLANCWILVTFLKRYVPSGKVKSA